MGSALKPGQRIALALLWLALLAVAGWAIGQRLHLTGDLRKFLPRQAGSRLVAWLQAAAKADGTPLEAPGTTGRPRAAHVNAVKPTHSSTNGTRRVPPPG